MPDAMLIAAAYAVTPAPIRCRDADAAPLMLLRCALRGARYDARYARHG